MATQLTASSLAGRPAAAIAPRRGRKVLPPCAAVKEVSICAHLAIEAA